MNSINANIDIFFSQYNFTKRNYNIIVSSDNGTGKFDFIEAIIQKYFNNLNVKINNLISAPDILYISLPLYDKSGKQIRVIDNSERLLYEFGFEDKFDNYRVGSEISIDQIRQINEFSSITSIYNHKFIIINNCNFLNQQSSAALLKILEETNTACVFFLLSSDIGMLKDTIKSRCHVFNLKLDNDYKIGDSFFNYFLSLRPKLYQINKSYDYMREYNLVENEISDLYSNKSNPLAYSTSWMERGSAFIEYLQLMFNFLLQGFYHNESNELEKKYLELHKKIPIKPNQLLKIIHHLNNFKMNIRANLNKKLFYDNLLIVLNRELY